MDLERLDTRLNSLRRLVESDEDLQGLRRQVRASPDDQQARQHLARALARAGNHVEAAETLAAGKGLDRILRSMSEHIAEIVPAALNKFEASQFDTPKWRINDWNFRRSPRLSYDETTKVFKMNLGEVGLICPPGTLHPDQIAPYVANRINGTVVSGLGKGWEVAADAEAEHDEDDEDDAWIIDVTVSHKLDDTFAKFLLSSAEVGR